MTTPDESVPAEPPVVPEEAAAQDAAAEAEQAAAAQLDAIRELATEIAKQTLLDFDPATIRKGAVTAIATTSAPPTLSVQISGDTTTTIDGVRYIEGYNPVVGDVVQFFKQGTDLIAFGKVAEQFSQSTWTLAPLGSGWSHNGNSGGNVMYRKVWDHGSPKMEWKGTAARSSGTAVLGTPLDSTYRPAVLRPTTAARTGTGGANSVKLDFYPDGTVLMVGGATAPSGTAAAASGTTGSESGHNHGITNNDHSHGGDTNSGGSHGHGIANNDHNHGSPTGTTSGHSHSIATTTHKHGSATDGEPGGTSSAGSHSHSIPTTTHKHGDPTAGNDGGTSGTEAHSHSLGSHTHTVDITVTDPTWISFNGISYYLD